MRRVLIYLMVLAAVAACSKDDHRSPQPIAQLVVEGWIEDGEFPVVLLTHSIPISSDPQLSSELGQYVIRWAKVTVSDGNESVVLTGKPDNGYFPPYIYTTGRLRGEAGKTYSLTVEYDNRRAQAVTTIPLSPAQCSLKVSECPAADTLYRITATFTDNPAEKNRYQFFTRTGTTVKQFQASYLGSIDDALLDGTTEFPVYRGRQLNEGRGYTPYFSLNDTVSVKFAQVDGVSFRIWDSYTKMLSLSGNAFLSTSTDIESNIEGGYGYWCGYNSQTHNIIIRDSIQHATVVR